MENGRVPHIVPAPAADATFAVIAGGLGRRLGGVAKGLLRREGRTLLEGQLELARSLEFAEVLLSTSRPEPYARFGLRTVPDALPDRGAPGGVHAALAAARTPWVVAVAADMPFVGSPAVLALLGARTASAELICFQVGGRLEPLLAAYRAELAPRWELLLRAEPLSFARLFEHFRTLVLPEEALIAVDPSLASVVSVNTPEGARAAGVELPAG
jgi:molybdopterin-guanine dinucleotide biosynthesis protein A